jgi:hypothetical protein
VVAVREAVRAFAGFATFGHAHIRGLAQDLCSSHVRCLKSSAPTRGVGAQATNRGVVCASRECSDRLANRNGLSAGGSVSVSQRELVSLLRVVGVGIGSGLVVVQVAISQQ